MLGVKVSVLRYVSDEPQPGIVEFQLEEANGHRCLFMDKTAIVSTASLDAQATYPQPGIIACEIVRRSRDTAQPELVRISTQRPWYVESVDGLTEFDVLPEELVGVKW